MIDSYATGTASVSRYICLVQFQNFVFFKKNEKNKVEFLHRQQRQQARQMVKHSHIQSDQVPSNNNDILLKKCMQQYLKYE